ncbi:MCOLN2 (predicted) [Pycnogonum litorale]
MKIYSFSPDCLTIPSKIITDTFSTEIFLKNNNFSISFSRLKSAHLKFSIKSVFLKSLKPWDLPDCYKFKISINFDNSNHDGLIAINMDIDFVRLVCHGNIQYADKNIEQNVIDDVLVAAVIIMCMTSMILCSRALYRAQTLRVETVLFFKRQYNKNLPWKDKMEFLNLWYITIIINDVLIISGSILKLIIAHTDALTSSHNDLYILCTISLGVGNLLMWCGVLRYFGFFPKYNILILTLKKALPDVLRYLLCVVFIFMGFAICGWLVLGPYHYKFRTLLRTFQCLFALVNGDDMFATFQMVSKDAKVVIDWFCMIYLYSFVSLFIYIVLSLFIAVIMEAYELIKV